MKFTTQFKKMTNKNGLIGLILCALLCIQKNAAAQELKAQVQVVAQQVTNVDPTVFQELEKSCTQFLNNTKWTTDNFSIEERIECSFLINITKAPSVDAMEGNLQISFRRPVYGSSYFTTILNIKDDDFAISYQPFQVMEFSEQSNLSNLTSILAFYAYYILGLDYDSFSPEGGSIYYKKAQNIVLNAQSSSAKGWKSFESQRNRYWMVDDLLNPAFKSYRQMLYDYHRSGMDNFSTDFAKSRKVAIDALATMDNIYKQRPNAFLIQIFLNAKRDEALALCKEAPKDEIQAIVPIMAKIDGAFASKWTELLK